MLNLYTLRVPLNFDISTLVNEINIKWIISILSNDPTILIFVLSNPININNMINKVGMYVIDNRLSYDNLISSCKTIKHVSHCGISDPTSMTILNYANICIGRQNIIPRVLSYTMANMSNAIFNETQRYMNTEMQKYSEIIPVTNTNPQMVSITQVKNPTGGQLIDPITNDITTPNVIPVTHWKMDTNNTVPIPVIIGQTQHIFRGGLPLMPRVISSEIPTLR